MHDAGRLRSKPHRPRVGEWKASMTTVQSGRGDWPFASSRAPRPFPSTEAVGSSIVGAGKVAAGEMLADLHRSESDLRRFLHGLPGSIKWRRGQGGSLATRSIKTSASCGPSRWPSPWWTSHPRGSRHPGNHGLWPRRADPTPVTRRSRRSPPLHLSDPCPSPSGRSRAAA